MCGFVDGFCISTCISEILAACHRLFRYLINWYYNLEEILRGSFSKAFLQIFLPVLVIVWKIRN